MTAPEVELPPPSGEYLALRDAVCESQDRGFYPEWLREFSGTEEDDPRLRELVVEELRGISALDTATATAEVDRVLRYHSRKHGELEDTALRFPEAVPYYRGGRVQDWGRFADDLIARVEWYDFRVMAPLCRQVGRWLAGNAGDRPVLFLGRDFTPPYVYLSAEKSTVDPKTLHLARVSREVKDLVLRDGTSALWDLGSLLGQVGLTGGALSRGLVVADSCMNGKIPAVVFRALVTGMDNRAARAFLSRSLVVYAKSGRLAGEPLAERALRVGTGSDENDGRRLIWALLERLEGIEEFGLRVPDEVAEHADRRHKLFDWRPKAAPLPTGLTPGGRTSSAASPSPSDRVLSLLGLRADLGLQRLGRLDGRVSRAFARGVRGARRWVRRAPVDVEPTVEGGGLWAGDELLCRVKRVVGEGRNVVAWLTEAGTVAKVAKPGMARKNLLLAWAEPLVRERGIDVARVLRVDRRGLVAEQEHVLPLLAPLSPPTSVDRRLREGILSHYHAARRLAVERNVWLDLKVANYGVRDGRPVLLDFVPRTNRTYFRFFLDDDGQPLDDEQFLRMFYGYDDLRARFPDGRERAEARRALLAGESP